MQGSMHYGTITGLAPDTTYYYTYGDAALNLFAPEASFVTPPLPSAADKIHFIAWADAGQANAGQQPFISRLPVALTLIERDWKEVRCLSRQTHYVPAAHSSVITFE